MFFGWVKQKLLYIGLSLLLLGGAISLASCSSNTNKLPEFEISNKLHNDYQDAFFYDYSSQEFDLFVNTPTEGVNYNFSLFDDGGAGSFLSVTNKGTYEATLFLTTGLAVGNYGYKIEVTATKNGFSTEKQIFSYDLKILNAFSDFTINDNTPSSISYGYSLTSWYASTNNLVPDGNVEWAISNLSSNLNNQLSINTSTGELQLTTGLACNQTYSYRIVATAKHGGDIQDKTVIKDVSFGIIKANLPSFEISPINLNGAFGYTSLTASLSNNLLAEANDYLGTITYSIVDQSEIGGRLSITDNNTLTLSSGLGVGTYNFTLRASASADINYNEAWSDDDDFSITISRGTFPLLNFGNTLVSQVAYNASVSGQASLSVLPVNTNVRWGLQNISDPSLSNHLFIDEDSGVINLTAGLDFASTPYTYEITAELENNGYNTEIITSNTYSLQITKIDFGATYSISNSMPDECEYNHSSSGLATLIGTTPTGTSVAWRLTDYTLLSSNLSINSSGEITLTPGVNARDDPYIYSIAADISNPNYNDLTVTSGPYDLTITKSTSIGNYQINTTIGDAYTYGQTASGACSLSIVPPAGTTVTWSLEDNDDLASYLTINPTTGAISLTSGKNSSATAYSYKIHAHLDFINYQPKDVYLTKTMTINKATFNTPTFTNPLLTSYMYNTSDSKTVTLSSLPPSTTVVYGLTDVSTGLSGYLQINSSGIISLSAGANYNATNYTYKITAQLTNSNYVTTTFTSQTYSLDITKSTALVAFDATVSGSLLLNVGYAQTSLTLGNNYSNPPPNTSFSYQKVNGDSRFTISGQTLTVATGLGSGNHTVTLTSTASNSNYVDKISATLTLVFRVGADINPTATGNYVAPAYNDGPNYAPSNPFIGAIGLRWSSPNNSVPYPNDSGHKNISSLTFNIVFGQNRIVTGFQLKARPQNEWTPSTWVLKAGSTTINQTTNYTWGDGNSVTFAATATAVSSSIEFAFTGVYRSVVQVGEEWCGFVSKCIIYGVTP